MDDQILAELMALRFQYNKIALQELERGLKIRKAAVPTLQAKEAALRLEVKRLHQALDLAEEHYHQALTEAQRAGELWEEFDPRLVHVQEIGTRWEKLAGVRFQVLESVHFANLPVAMIHQPLWVPEGIPLLQNATERHIRVEYLRRQAELLEYERKKTTQKLNLYEKVQIPEFEDGIRRIKRFLEDEENLAKAAQKIVKKRKEALQS
jgi:V/A-type H+-transporting ATPase subunit D